MRAAVGWWQGIGKEHAKWSPVSVATYQFDPIIELNQGQHTAYDRVIVNFVEKNMRMIV